MADDVKQLPVKITTKILTFLRKVSTRQSASYLLMVAFIIFISIGAGMYNPAIGFIAAGIACGILGFLLGLE